MTGRPDVQAALDAAFQPRSVAVIGASAAPGKLGNLALRILGEGGFAGTVHPVNPAGGEILGLPVMRSLAEIEGEIDVALAIVPAERFLPVLRDCAAKRVRLVAAITSGFAEAGEPGRAFQRELDAFLPTAPFRLIGPNCEGYVVPRFQAFLTFSGMFLGLQPGPIGVISQSGALSGVVAYRLNRAGAGVSALVSTGNEADVKAADLLEWFAEDDETRAVLCYLEEIREPERFWRMAKRLRRRGKELVLQKAGRGEAGRAAVAAHTGADAGDDAAVDERCRALGVARVPDLTAAMDAAVALSQGRRLEGRRIGVVSIAGGLGAEMTDLLETAAFEVPPLGPRAQAAVRAHLPFFGAARNPIDMTAAMLGRPESLSDVLDVVLAENGLDGFVVILTFAADPAIPAAIVRAMRSTEKPVLLVWTGDAAHTPASLAALRENGVPVFDAPVRALNGFKALRASRLG